MKNRIYIIALLAVLTMSIPIAKAGSVTTRVTLAQPSIEHIDTFTMIKVNGWDQMTQPGTPALPVKYVRMLVPEMADNFTLNVTRIGSQNINNIGTIYPAQQPTVIGDSITFTQPDPAVYAQNVQWPTVDAEIVDDGYYDGSYHIITVAVYPIKFNGPNKAVIYPNLNVTLNYDIVSTKATMPIYPLFTTEFNKDYVRRMVCNPTAIDNYAPNVCERSALSQSQEDSVIDYVIVTGQSLVPAFDKLIAWKRQKGYKVGIYAIEDILADPRYAQGDTISGINDDAGKLRAFLHDCKINHGTQYTLLAGDYTVLPIRYAYTDTAAMNSSKYYVPTDLYFAEFNGNWYSNYNADRHNLYEGIEFKQDLYIGRLLCNANLHVINYVDKLILYELDPGKGDRGYLKKLFGFEQNYSFNDMVTNVAQSFGEIFRDNVTILKNSNSQPNRWAGTDVVSEMNNRHGYFTWCGHGNPGGIHVSARYGLNAIQGIPSFYADWDLCPDYEITKNAINNLTNFDYPSIAYSLSCTICPFDIFRENPTCIYDFEYNMGSSFTVAGKFGGPAMLGNSRVGFFGYSEKLEQEFAKAILRESPKLGVAEAISKTELLYSSNNKKAKHVVFTHHLIGEPEFEMWTDIPQDITDINIYRSENGLSISGVDEDFIIGIYEGDANPQLITTASSADVIVNNISPNSIVTIYKHNFIPYIAPLYLQKENLARELYFFADTAYLGAAVDSNRSEGDYCIVENGKLTIDAMNCINVTDGFVVDDGGIVILKSESNIVVSGGKVKSGGTLIIESASFEISDNFEVEDGGTLIIK